MSGLLRILLPVLLALAALGCAQVDPYCSVIIDATGAPVAFCREAREAPICDLPGEIARYEESATGFVLVGGAPARCSAASNEVECPDGNAPRCIPDPGL